MALWRSVRVARGQTFWFVVLLVAAAVFLAFRFYASLEESIQVGDIQSFADCVKAGNPVQESYPAQCTTQDGRSFAEDIGNVFEKADRVGGLLRYGIPDFKMEKHLIDRRVEQMEQEGVTFRTGVNAGFDVHGSELLRDYDAILIAIGSTIPRDLPVPGRELQGIHFAMEFLPQQNRRVAGLPVNPETSITATGKQVVIIGGGDTGSDCLGTSIRQEAAEIHMIELLPMPPSSRTSDMPWPNWPMTLRIESSHEEGGQRQWSIATKKFTGENGYVKKLHAVRLEWNPPDGNGRRTMQEIPGSEFEIDADLVLLALGFLYPQPDGLVQQLGLKLDPRGNIAVDENFMAGVPGVFAAGDAQRGQSLVVWALAGGRKAARAADLYLMGKTSLPI